MATLTRVSARCLTALAVAMLLVLPVLPTGPASASGGTANWSLLYSQNPYATVNNLNAISCVSATDCVAVGYGSQAVNSLDLIQTWDGTSWTAAAAPSPPSNDTLNAVSCSSATFCVAVGYYQTSPSTFTSLIEQWDGVSWAVVPSPDPGTAADALYGVSCISSTHCVAVGYSSDTSAPSVPVDQTLVETWDGVSWTQQASPNPGGATSQLKAVSCASATMCLAGGSTANGLDSLVETWDGVSWTQQASLSPGAAQNDLAGVSCTSSTTCMVVGTYTQSGGLTEFPLIEQWNGVSLTQQTGPAPWVVNSLSAVSCTSSSACIATGYSTDTFGNSYTLALAYNGTAWSTTNSLNPAPVTSSGQANAFTGVWCTAPFSCIAVGNFSNTVGTGLSLVEQSTLVPTVTATALAPTVPSVVGQSVTYTATVSPAPDGGTVGFADGGRPVGECLAQPVDPVSGIATCTVTYFAPGSPSVSATYSGAPGYGSSAASPVIQTVTVAPAAGNGYWLAGSDGGVFGYGAPFFGSAGATRLNQPIVGVTGWRSGQGYWLVARDGGVFSYGGAAFEGSLPSVVSVSDIVGMAVDPATGGYWLVGSDGGVFAFHAPFLGSVPGYGAHVGNIVGMAPVRDGKGYYLVGADGNVYPFGSATFHGSMGGTALGAPIAGLAVDPATGGYWLVGADGGVFAFDAPFAGSAAGVPHDGPIVGMASDSSGGGYWLAGANGGVYAFGDAPFQGSAAGQSLQGPVVGITSADAQVG
jgi:hypothetical protein